MSRSRPQLRDIWEVLKEATLPPWKRYLLLGIAAWTAIKFVQWTST